MPETEPSFRLIRSGMVRELSCWCFYLLIAIYVSWPLAGSLFSAVPLGAEGEATVPLLNVWTLWWNSDRAAAGLRHYWDAPIFYPTQGTFAFSEAQPTMIVAAPIVWLTGNRALAYNAYLLTILTLNGISGRCLLRRLGHLPWLSLCGGIMCEMLPFVWWQLGVVQLTTVFGMIWTIHALIDVFDPESDATTRSLSDLMIRYLPAGRISDPTVVEQQTPDDLNSTLAIHKTVPWMDAMIRGIRLGGSFTLTYWACNYWGLFLVLLTIPSSVVLWNRRLIQCRFWCEVALAALIAVVFVGPIAFVQRSLSVQHAWTREQSLILDLSAHPQDYLDTPRTLAPSPQAVSRLPSQSGDGEAAAVAGSPNETIAWKIIPGMEYPETTREDVWPLGGGGLKVLIMPYGLASALLTSRRRWGLFVAAFGGLAYGISLGPKIQFLDWVPLLHGLCPYVQLQRYVPGFSLIRSPFRFALFVQLAIAWLTIEALDLFNPWRWVRRVRMPPTMAKLETLASLPTASATQDPSISRPSIIQVIVAWALMVTFSLMVVFEVRPPRQRLYSDATSKSVPAWILWLRENSVPGDAIICLPFPNGYTVHDYEPTSIWMYWGTFHGRPLVNGYSGFFPQPFVTLKDQLSLEPTGNETHLNEYASDNPGLVNTIGTGAKFAIVKRSFATRDDVWEHPATKYRWQWVTGDEQHQLDIYSIQPATKE